MRRLLLAGGLLFAALGAGSTSAGHLSGFHCHGPSLLGGRTGAIVTCYKAIQSRVSWALTVTCYVDSQLQGFPTIVATSSSLLNGTKVKYCPAHKPFAFRAGILTQRV